MGLRRDCGGLLAAALEIWGMTIRITPYGHGYLVSIDTGRRKWDHFCWTRQKAIQYAEETELIWGVLPGI